MFPFQFSLLGHRLSYYICQLTCFCIVYEPCWFLCLFYPFLFNPGVSIFYTCSQALLCYLRLKSVIHSYSILIAKLFNYHNYVQIQVQDIV